MNRIIGSAMVVAAMAAAMLGCSIHTQAPIKEVAYDFSDRDFYDRAYGASPDYSQSEQDDTNAVAENETQGACPFTAASQGGGCSRVYVEHHHYYEDGDRRGSRHGHARADADRDDDTTEDTRQAERPARPRVRVEVEAPELEQAPAQANRSTRPTITRDEPAPAERAEAPVGRAEAPVGHASTRTAPASAPASPQRPDAPVIGSAPRQLPTNGRRVQVDIQ